MAGTRRYRWQRGEERRLRGACVAVAALALVAPALAPVAVAGGAPERGAQASTTGLLGQRGVPDASGPPTANATSAPRIVAVYPDPVRDGDPGEFLTLRLPAGAGPWRLTDGESTVRVPVDDHAGGLVAVGVTAGRPNRTPPGVPVVDAAGGLALANGGEVIRLRHGNATVDVVRYGETTEGELWRPAAGTWRPPGATDRAPVSVSNATVTGFVLPDRPEPVLATLRSADRRILLAGYTFSSTRTVRALARAADRGVAVRVLLEGAPVGGITRRQARVLDRLVAAGVEVRVLAGPATRYRFHHAKYAVVDDRALVTSENWERSGLLGHGSRGWGAVVRSGRVAADLAALFRADFGWRAARSWSAHRAGRQFRRARSENGTRGAGYPARFDRATVQANVRVVTAPDNAEAAILDLVQSADTSIDVQQVSVRPGHPFLAAVVAAARRGVRVRVLLSGAWYVREENRKTVQYLETLADRDGLPISARLADPRSRFAHVHTKGVVVDGDRALVGSVNWNNVSVRENREVALILQGDRIGSYYQRVFVADWRGGAWRLPRALVGLTALGALLAARRVAARVRFADSGRSWDPSVGSVDGRDPTCRTGSDADEPRDAEGFRSGRVGAPRDGKTRRSENRRTAKSEGDRPSR